jgi:hypothetical protein
MRYLNHPSIDPNEIVGQVTLDENANILDVTGEIALFKDPDSDLRTFLKASSSLSNSYTLTLPPNAGTPGQVLTTDGSGNLLFKNPDIGGNRIFVSVLNGDDANDGYNQPVKTIKKAAQIASSYSTPVNNPGQPAYDSRTLLRNNKSFIEVEVIAFIDYCVLHNITPFSSSFTYNKIICSRDIGYAVESVIYDLIYGGNAQSIYNGGSYYTAIASVDRAKYVAAINYAKYVSAAVLNNTALTPTSGGLYDNAPYQSAVSQTIDLTKSPSSPNKTKIAGGFNIITGILTNGLNTGPTLVNPQYIPLPVTIEVATGEYYEDNPIITPDKSTIVGDDLRSVIIRPLNPGKDMFRVRTGMYMTGFTFRDAISPTGVPVSTWNYAISFDDVNDYTVNRGSYVGLAPSKPIVNLSPYIQNCSIISFLGGNGCLVDGSKVANPNVYRVSEEEENPVSGKVPSQGKSMVANAFTMVSFGGTGWKVINEAYVQLVSCFQIFMLNGVYCESGGYASITNSATNFGINALRAAGYNATTFDFDKGVICNVGYDVSGYQTLTTIGHGRIPVNHYILKFKDDSLIDITSNYKTATPITITIDASSAISSYQINYTAHGFSNGASVVYTNTGTDLDITGLTSGDIYYVQFISLNSFALYYDNSLTKQVLITTGTGTQHTFTENQEEFYLNEITDTHTSYQKLTLTSGSYTFTPGYQISGTVGSNTNAAYVYSWNSSTYELVVSLITVSNGGSLTKLPFTNTSTINADNAVSPNTNIAIASVETITNLHTATFTVRSTLNHPMIGTSNLQSKIIWLNKPSIVNSSSHTWEYAGSGTDYNALPDNGGKTNVALQQVAELPGRVYTSGTNELGDFTVGDFITAYNRTGNIIFNNKVSVNELTALKLSLSDISITAISTDVGLGDDEVGGASNARLTTQLAIRSFLANRLGDFIDKHVSTSAIPASVVQLNGNGQINADLIPAIRGFNTHIVHKYNGRLSIYEQIPVDEALAGDVIAENYYVTLLTLSGPVSLAQDSIVTQATTGATGIVTNTVSNSNAITLASITGVFDTNLSHGLSSGSSLGVYPTIVSTPNSTSQNFYLALDNKSQYLRLKTTNNYRFTIGNTVTAAVNGAEGTITDYRCGYISYLGTITAGSGYTPLGSSTTYYNVPLTGGTGKYTSAAGATSSSTLITVTSTTGLEIGMLVTVTAGTGSFAAGTVVTDISRIHIEVSQEPIIPLSNGAVVRADATGAYADITVSSGTVTSVDLYRGGVGYQVGDVLSVNSANVGGTGAGFSVPVGAIEKRLYVDIANHIKFVATSIANDYIEDDFTNSFSITLDSTTVDTFNANSVGAGGNVDYTTNRITISTHGFTNGDPVNYNSGTNTPLGNLIVGNTYYVGVVDTNTIELYVDYALGIKKTLGTSSSGTHSLTRYTLNLYSNRIVAVAHGLSTGAPIRISDYTITPPTALINGTTTSVPTDSYWFVGSVTENSFTLHQYISDAEKSVATPTVVNGVSINIGVTNNELHFATTGSGNATFTFNNVPVVSTVNTSSKIATNYSVLSTTTIDASSVITGTFNTTRLGNGTANSSTYLRGDSSWHNATESVSKAPNSPITISGDYSSTSVTVSSIVGTIGNLSISSPYTATITGISSTTQLFAGMTLTGTGIGAFGGTTTILSVDSSSQITIGSTTACTTGTITFTATASLNQYYGNPTIDIIKVDSNLPGSGTYTNVGVAAFDSTYISVGTGSGAGNVSIKQGVIDAGTLGGGGKNSAYYLNPSNLQSLVPVNKGGTNLSSYTTGDILYATGSTTLGKLTVGSAGYVLSSANSLPVWVGYTGSSSSYIVYSENPTLTLGLTAGSTTFNLVNTTATTVNFAAAATTANIGYAGSNASTTNISTGPVQASTTKTINIGTGGNYTSTTNLNLGYTGSGSANVYIGSPVGGTTTINSSSIVGYVGSQALFNTTATTINFGGAATSMNIGASTGTTTINNDLAVVGNFIVNGTTTTINSTIVTIDDKNIQIGYPISPATASNFTANGGGITLMGGSDGDKTIVWDSVNSNWTSSEYWNIASGKTYKINNVPVLTSSAVLNDPTQTTVTIAGYATTLSIGYTGSGTVTVGNDLTVTGNLTVNGTTTTVNSTTVNVDDKNLELGSVDTPTNTTADGGGITLKGATDKTIIWDNTNANWTSSEYWNIASGKTYKINNVPVLTSSAVLNDSTQTSITIGGSATTISIGASSGTLTIGNATITGTNATAFNMNGTSPSIVTSSTGTASIFNTSATTGNLFGQATTANIGYTGSSTGASFTQNYSTGYVGSGATETVNIGTGGILNSTTNVNIGSQLGKGTTTINSPVVVGYVGSQALFNTTATTINFAGAATSLNIGAATGTLTIGNATITGTNATTFNMNGANPSIVTSSTGTASVFNTNALTGNLFGAATSISIGASSGTFTIGNATITGTNATTFNMNGANPSIVTSSTGTASVFNTNALTGNLFGAATSISIGASSGTFTIGNATITGTNAATFNMNGANPSIVTSSTGTASVFNTNALTGNLFGQATTANIGYTGSSTGATFNQNYSSGYIGSGATGTVNIGTGGVSNSTTNVNIGNTNSNGTIALNNNVTIGGSTVTFGSTVSTTVTTASITSSATAVDSWAYATYRSAKYVVQVTCTASTGSNANTYQVSEILVIHNGAVATMTEYGAIKTTNDLATITVDFNNSSNGLVRLLAVAANSGDTITVKLYRTLITV